MSFLVVYAYVTILQTTNVVNSSLWCSKHVLCIFGELQNLLKQFKNYFSMLDMTLLYLVLHGCFFWIIYMVIYNCVRIKI